MIRLRALALSVVLLSLSGCGFIDYFFLPPAQDTAQELYEAGVESLKAKKYSDAITLFLKLKDRYPFSPYAPNGLAFLGDAYFSDEQYQQAAEAYKEFESLFPRNELMPYILFQVGMSNFKRSPSIDMPQDQLAEAIQYFKLVEQTFPNSEFAPKAKDLIVQCRTRMAEHELFVADFYWRSDRYGPAWKRYSYVVENFPDLPKIAEYAKARSQLAYLEYQKNRSNEERMEQEGSVMYRFKKWL